FRSRYSIACSLVRMQLCVGCLICCPFDRPLLLVIQRDPHRSTLFPYSTLFRSVHGVAPFLPGLLGRQQGRLQDRRGIELEIPQRSEEHTSELQSRENLVCRLRLEKRKDTYCTTTRRNRRWRVMSGRWSDHAGWT